MRETGDVFAPFVLLDPCGAVVEPVAAHLADLQAAGRPVTTQRSYAMALPSGFRSNRTMSVPIVNQADHLVFAGSRWVWPRT